MDGGSPTFDYPALVREALVGVVRTVLARVAEEGLPGDHHILLTFGVADAGVEVPPTLRRQFPREMTIVLQHQFWNLAVDDAGLAVTLRFGGRPERLVVPWPAVRAFVDPSVDFGFRLVPAEAADEAQPTDSAEAPVTGSPSDAAGAARPSPGPSGEAKVVAFRRRPE